MAKHLVQLNASGLPSLGEGLSKKQIAALADQSVDQLLEQGNVFQVAEVLAAMEEFARAVRKNERYIQFLRDELAKHHGKLETRSGTKIEICEAGVSYDYSNNGEWRMLDEEIRMLQERKKALEERLRKLSPGRMAIDPETGEVIEGPMKTSRSTYRITLSK